MRFRSIRFAGDVHRVLAAAELVAGLGGSDVTNPEFRRRLDALLLQPGGAKRLKWALHWLAKFANDLHGLEAVVEADTDPPPLPPAAGGG